MPSFTEASQLIETAPVADYAAGPGPQAWVIAPMPY